MDKVEPKTKKQKTQKQQTNKNMMIPRLSSCVRKTQTRLPMNVICAASSSSSTESYSERQQKLGRPLSPHVTTYKFPVVAISSIVVRATGVGLSAGNLLSLFIPYFGSFF